MISRLYTTTYPLVSELYEMEKRIYHNQMVEDITYYPTKIGIEIGGINGQNIISFLEHEMAHILEMKEMDRLLLPNFGIKEFLPAKTNSKAWFFLALRESRVRAIQAHLMRKTWKAPRSYHEYVGSDYSFGKINSSKQLDEFTTHIYDTAFNSWNEERIRFEWDRRLNFLREWMETA